MKKRFLFLNLFIIICVIASVITVFACAGKYTQTLELVGDVPADSVPEFHYDYGNIRVTDYSAQGNRLSFTVEGVSQGKDYLEINLPMGGDEAFYHFDAYQVGWFNTVYLMTNYDFMGKEIVICIFFAAAAAIFCVSLWSFIEKLRKAEYSYSMIAYGGVAFFVFWMIFDLLFVNSAGFDYFGNFLTQVEYSGMEFITLITPLSAIFCVAVTVSNIFLMVREGFRPVNALGILFSVLMIGARALIFGVFWYMSGSETEIKIYNAIMLLGVTLLSYFESMLFSTVVCAYLASRHKPSFVRDYLVILGCAIRRDGSLTPLLRGRVDSAIKYENEQFEKTGRHAVFVPSGGQGSDEVISEGEAMKRYLLEQGVPEERILPEVRSTDTRENLLFSKEVIEGSRPDEGYKAAFATTNYHVFRGYIMSQKAGLDAEGISAKTKWYFFPNAFLREFVGLVFDKKVNNIIIAAALVAGFVVINFIIPL